MDPEAMMARSFDMLCRGLEAKLARLGVDDVSRAAREIAESVWPTLVAEARRPVQVDPVAWATVAEMFTSDEPEEP